MELTKPRGPILGAKVEVAPTSPPIARRVTESKKQQISYTFQQKHTKSIDSQ